MAPVFNAPDAISAHYGLPTQAASLLCLKAQDSTTIYVIQAVEYKMGVLQVSLGGRNSTIRPW